MYGGQNYAETPITEIADRRSLSQPSTTERGGVLRGGIKQRTHKSLAVEFASMSSDVDLPRVQTFPSDETESSSIAQTASSSGHLGSQQKERVESDAETTDLALMMKKLFADQELKQQQLFKAFEDRHSSEIKQAILFTIADQIQPLGLAIDAERAVRVQEISKVQNQIAKLR